MRSTLTGSRSAQTLLLSLDRDCVYLDRMFLCLSAARPRKSRGRTSIPIVLEGSKLVKAKPSCETFGGPTAPHHNHRVSLAVSQRQAKWRG